MNPKEASEQLRIEEFEYDLPPELVAQMPLPVRHESRLLELGRKDGAIAHRRFADIVDVLRPGDLLVVNNTKVIPARVIAHRASGGTIKLLLLKPRGAGATIWEALVTPIKRIKPGEILSVNASSGSVYDLRVVDIVTGADGFKRLIVDLKSQGDVYALLAEIGQAPLPPYIHRDVAQEKQLDMERYQTVYATAPGAVAAPTAGLHFSPQILEKLQEKGVELEQITLHVGAGTFKPIEYDVQSHTIEPEIYSIGDGAAAAVNNAKRDGRRVIGVGTTTLRALESSALEDGRVQAADNAATTLYVKPGFHFQVLDGMVTNFHLSRSSLLVLVAAFAGRDQIMSAYKEAIARRYRFYSYGDAMLIL
ncbi:MAG TPA: tRNA preQ1(34) S-adenosylmethionine ribosyltransferase-isomerase QueA [Planktothrix sp.]|jgi:S-adenosylmethionine:tRNA ribosyltransferase-isomerase